jgi:hypothetical protein
MPPRKPRDTDSGERVLRGIAVTVTAVWVITTLAQVIDPHRQVPETVNYIFGIVVSSLFGAAAIKSRNKNGNGKNGGH